MIIDEINKQSIDAMKNKDEIAKGIFSIVKNKILLAKIDKKAKQEELTEADVISILQKTVKEIEEEKQSFASAGRDAQVTILEKQKSILEAFLPKLMSDEEIKEVISSLEDKSIANVMKYFKQNYAGKCDMSKVSAIAKKLN
jgi:uncharacterized protein